jgi:alpha/beta superfamily hydrolase
MESLFLVGPAGRLEALLEEPEDSAPRAAALVCHPHPQHGGTMHNKVVHRMARGLRRSGHVVLRFNYRGVNLSEGTYAGGEGELQDAQVALAYLRGRYVDLPYTIAGFSFGSRIALRLGCGDGSVNGAHPATPTRIIAVGFPTAYSDRSNLEGCITPRVFIQSTHDEFGAIEELRATFENLPEPKQLILVEARDHFFSGALEQLEEKIAGLG